MILHITDQPTPSPMPSAITPLPCEPAWGLHLLPDHSEHHLTVFPCVFHYDGTDLGVIVYYDDERQGHFPSLSVRMFL
jgi:hypothetical protein